MPLHPQGIVGPWSAGIVLDWHTLSSQVTGHNEFGHPIFDTKRSEVGELLYRFKYQNDRAALAELLRVTIDYLGDKVRGRFDLIVPVPPSLPSRQVTALIAEGLANGLGSAYSATALTKTRSTKELKSVTDLEVRKQMLEGAFAVDRSQVEGRTVLLVDDVYRSGATLESAAAAITSQGNPQTVYVLAVTRTRVHR